MFSRRPQDRVNPQHKPAPRHTWAWPLSCFTSALPYLCFLGPPPRSSVCMKALLEGTASDRPATALSRCPICWLCPRPQLPVSLESTVQLPPANSYATLQTQLACHLFRLSPWTQWPRHGHRPPPRVCVRAAPCSHGRTHRVSHAPQHPAQARPSGCMKTLAHAAYRL